MISISRGSWKFVISTLFILYGFYAPAWAEGFPGGLPEAWGPLYGVVPQEQRNIPSLQLDALQINSVARLRNWNRIAIDTSGLDHTAVAPGETRIFGEQLGPVRSIRAMAIVHIAVFEAVNAISRRHRSYTGLPAVLPGTSVDAAIAQAAYGTLVALFPSHKPRLDRVLSEDLNRIPRSIPKQRGIQLGQQSAARILALRANDGSQHSEPRIGIEFITSNDPGKWRQDPISRVPLAVGAFWGGVRPFILRSADQFRIPPPPSLGSPEYVTAFNEVKRLGGDGIVTPTERTAEQTAIGIYWAYDGTPSLCAPPRLYNQVATQIADQMGSNLVEYARLLAIVNVAMADEGIAGWESKYHYQFWRPVTGIREAGIGTGTVADPAFSPLGAPASNLSGPNFTPPFPAYPSGHAGFGGTLFQVLRKFYGTDRIPFTFVSDELNGVTRDNNGNIRPLVPRSFSTLSQAEEENGQSRIYLGIHWAFDKTEGITQGRRVADEVFSKLFLPR